MKAAVCREFKKPLVIEDIKLAEPGPNDIKVKIKACGICHSDIHFIEGAWGGKLPAVYGHEGAGIVEKVGRNVRHVKPGDHVVVTLVRSCGVCPACAAGNQVLCEGSFDLSAKSPLTGKNGKPITHGLGTGAFAEYVGGRCFPSRGDSQGHALCARLPHRLRGRHRHRRGGEHRRCDRRQERCRDRHRRRRPQQHPGCSARRRLADHRHRRVAGEAEGRQALRRHPWRSGQRRRGQGSESADRWARRRLCVCHRRRQGRHRAGLPLVRGEAATSCWSACRPPTCAPTFDPVYLAYDEQRIIGSRMGSTRLQIDVPKIVELYKQGRVKLDELVTKTYPLAKINEAIEAVVQGKALRNVIVF